MKKFFGIMTLFVVIISSDSDPSKNVQSKSLSAVVDRDVLYASLEETSTSHANELLGNRGITPYVYDSSYVLKKMGDTVSLDSTLVFIDSLSFDTFVPDERIEKVRKYFAEAHLPLQYEAEHFVRYADEHNVEWSLLPAISFIESTGGKYACKKAENNAFGWGGCKISFDSYEEAIATITMKLGGGLKFYKGKDTRGILKVYNKVIPDYAEKVMKEMRKIENM